MIASLEHHAAAGNLWTHLFLAMPDHLHALMSFAPDQPMVAFIRNWKRFIAKQTGVVWQDGFFDHRPRTGESFDEKARYIRLNPVRAGLVPAVDPAAWTYVWAPATVAPAR